MKIPEIFKSKKFQAFALGMVAVACKSLLGLSEEQIQLIVGLVATYVLGQGVADMGKSAAVVSTEATKP